MALWSSIGLFVANMGTFITIMCTNRPHSQSSVGLTSGDFTKSLGDQSGAPLGMHTCNVAEANADTQSHSDKSEILSMLNSSGVEQQGRSGKHRQQAKRQSSKQASVAQGRRGRHNSQTSNTGDFRGVE